MPQIWMTYEEIAGLIGCAPEEACARAIDAHLDRKRSRDGKTRVKLGPAWTAVFIARLRGESDPLDPAIAELRAMHARMQRPATPEHHATRHDGDHDLLARRG